MSAELPVLVGIDGSPDGLIALSWAASYAVQHHAPLHAVYVLDEQRPVPTGTPPTGPDDGSEVLEKALRELERIGFTTASLEVRHGHPAKVLLELSERAQALIVGRRGVGGFAELLLGSASQLCTALSTNVPLVVVPDTWDPAAPRRGRIVVGIDGSPESQDAVRFAFEQAETTNAAVHGVHAVESRPDPHVWSDESQQPWTGAADERLPQLLDGWKAKYPQVTADQHTVADHPVRVLAHESDRADLVVVGGLGNTAFSELMGPVARGLLYHSRCPVAVVHHP